MTAVNFPWGGLPDVSGADRHVLWKKSKMVAAGYKLALDGAIHFRLYWHYTTTASAIRSAYRTVIVSDDSSVSCRAQSRQTQSYVCRGLSPHASPIGDRDANAYDQNGCA